MWFIPAILVQQERWILLSRRHADMRAWRLCEWVGLMWICRGLSGDSYDCRPSPACVWNVGWFGPSLCMPVGGLVGGLVREEPGDLRDK
jgi:hypothetical protein